LSKGFAGDGFTGSGFWKRPIDFLRMNEMRRKNADALVAAWSPLPSLFFSGISAGSALVER
jgi:hypothetical protein